MRIRHEGYVDGKLTRVEEYEINSEEDLTLFQQYLNSKNEAIPSAYGFWSPGVKNNEIRYTTICDNLTDFVHTTVLNNRTNMD